LSFGNLASASAEQKVLICFCYFRRLKALFSYSPEQDDELSLAVGDVIDFISEVEEGWWKGQLKGRTGIFPSNFVSDLEVEAVRQNDVPSTDNKQATKEPVKFEPTTHSDKKRSEVKG
jgi:hypothetical protein